VRFLRQKAGYASAQVFLCDAAHSYLGHSDRALYGERHDQAPDGTRTVEARIDVPLAWTLGLAVDEAELFAASRSFSRLLGIVLATSVLALGLWSLLASRRIVGPVQQLAKATVTIARGDLSARVPASGRGELAALGRAFNRMAEDLDRSREQLREADRQAAWAEMARQVAHEIKNPLTPMRMSAQLVQRAMHDSDARVPELTERLARTVLEQTDALARIASDFRQFAGAPTRQVERVEVDRLLDEVEATYAGVAAGGEVELRFERGAAGAAVDADRQELRRVLLNLVDNAQAAPARRIVVGSSSAGDRVALRVADDGPGIPAEVRGRLFEPYFTTKSSGTGLGLAICKKIVEAHRGTIELESSAPGHTVFRVELPCAPPAGAAGAR
jgi:nitrogen fixation/metabolism regulation signal transduction histidine kinase